jgi:hypothetical protein
MPSIHSLPTEIFDRFVSYIHVKAALANLRLVNRAFNDLTTSVYFATVPLYAHWVPTDDDDDDDDDGFGEIMPENMNTPNNIHYDAWIFKNILDSKRLKRLVNKVVIYTCNPDCVVGPQFLPVSYPS